MERDKELFHNLLKIKDDINFIKSPFKCDNIITIAVSKTKPLSDIEILVKLNHSVFGENYAQELAEKYDLLKEKPSFHFIGALQSNKVAQIIDKVDLIHSVDRISLAKEIDRCAGKINKKQDVLIQLNLTKEETKSGIDENNVEDFLNEIKDFQNIKVIGLMTMPFFSQDNEEVRPFFKQLRETRDYLNSKGFNLHHLSMGMSGDYKVAIEEGATIIRVGSSIFGSR